MHKLVVLTTVCLASFVIPGCCIDDNDGIERNQSSEYELYWKLLETKGRYESSVRPVLNHDHAVKVKIGVAILTIDEIASLILFLFC